MKSDDFGDRMKFYEMMEARRVLLPTLPILVRIDGRCFSSFTAGLPRPYYENLSFLMQETTKYLVSNVGARVGYTQSDEISLLLYQEEFADEIFFGGRVQKLVSVIASMATNFFVRNGPDRLASEKERLQNRWDKVMFDCRVWSLPSQEEAVNAILWREKDATKNSISMAARAYYSHAALEGKKASEMQEMLHLVGVNWNNYPDFFKRGTYIQRRCRERKFTIAEIEKLPPMHEARRDPNLVVRRTNIVNIAMPPLSKVVNRVEVLFNGADPLTTSSNG